MARHQFSANLHSRHSQALLLWGFELAGGALAFYILQRINGGLRLKKRSHYLHFAVFALFGIILNQLLFFHGLSLTTATNTSLLAVLIPIFAIIMSSAIGNDVLSGRIILGTFFAGLGVIYLIGLANFSFSSTTIQGDILIILNSISYAIYLATSKKLISRYGALKSIAWLFIFGSIVNVPVGLYSLQSVRLAEVSTEAWLAMFAVIIFPTILTYYLNAWALARVSPSMVAVYIYFQPLIGTFLAITILEEEWSLRIFFAMLLIFAGVFLVTTKNKRKPKTDLYQSRGIFFR